MPPLRSRTGATLVHAQPEVVVVEDDPALRVAIERVLRGARHRVRAFPSAEALLEALQGRALWPTVRCGICDVRLSGACGFELHRRLAAQGPLPPWIFMTAHDDPALRDQARRARAGYLAKPFHGRALLALVAGAQCD